MLFIRCIADAVIGHSGIAQAQRSAAIGQLALITIRIAIVEVVKDNAVDQRATFRCAPPAGKISRNGAIVQGAEIRRAAGSAAAAVGAAVAGKETVAGVAIDDSTSTS